MAELRDGTERPWTMPRTCPRCGMPAWRPPDEAVTRCTNVACPAQRLERLVHWAGRGAMDIDGLGEKLVARLVTADLVCDVSDFYVLDATALAALEMERDKQDGTPVVLGDVVAAKIAANIEASRDRPLWRLLFGLGIRHVGSTAAEVLAAHFRELDALAIATEEELTAIETVGPAIAASVANFFANPDNVAVIARLRQRGVRLADLTDDGPALPQTLAGLSFVLTGGLEKYTREEAGAGLKAYGAKVSGSVSKKTSFVVVGSDPGSKYDKAVEIGVPILSEEQLDEVLATGLPPDGEAPAGVAPGTPS